jgi:hypothetical protein
MFGWQPDTLKEWELTWSTSLWVLLVAGIVFLGTSAAALAFVVQMPTTYFRDPPSSAPWAGHRSALRRVARIGKNLLGVLAALAGIFLSLPGVPGPGLVFLLIGVMLLDFPGKLQLERRIVKQPGVLEAINWLRQRCGKPPLEVSNDATTQCREPAKVDG